MKAVVITRPGSPEVLELVDVPDPEPGPGDVRVRVSAAGVNRADLMQRTGGYAAPPGWPADIPGLEFAGEVDRLGADVEGWNAGDRVMGLAGGGAYAERVVVPAEHLLPIPDGMDEVEAAGIPEVFITAHDALRTRGSLMEGESVLIHAVGGGVGTAGLQIARAYGALVMGTSRSPWKLERAEALGLAVAIDLSGPDVAFAERVREVTDGRGADLVLDLVGGPYLAENLRSMGPLGRQVVVGLPGGRSAEVDLGLLLSKRLTLVGTALRSRSRIEKAAATRLFAEEVLPLLADGRIRPVVHEVIPAAQAGRAHEVVASNLTFGKVILRW